MIVSYVLLNVCNSTPAHSIPSLQVYFCDGDRDIVSEFNPGVSQGYRVTINKTLSVTTQIKVKLDSGSTIVLVSITKFLLFKYYESLKNKRSLPS